MKMVNRDPGTHFGDSVFDTGCEHMTIKSFSKLAINQTIW